MNKQIKRYIGQASRRISSTGVSVSQELECAALLTHGCFLPTQKLFRLSCLVFLWKFHYIGLTD